MSSTLISHSSDLRRLRDDGYAVSIVGAHLLLSDVPYVTANRCVARGTLVSELTLAGQVTATPSDHVMRFIGEMPCHPDGTVLHEMVIDSQPQHIDAELTTNHTFSHKPAAGYPDYFAKMTTYAAILTSRAQAIDPAVSAQTYPPVTDDAGDSPLRYLDTASSRAGITAVTSKLAVPKVAIIGLGGTGSYVLDFLAKTPIREIHLFDNDIFLQHNAFRSPGAATLDELHAHPTKVDYHTTRYTAMHHEIIPHRTALDETTIDEIDGMAFVFVCIDDGPAKKIIMDRCEQRGIAFVDTGIGVDVIDDALSGIIRTTISRPNPDSRAAARSQISIGDTGDDAYHHGVQLAELNALNAALAVIAFKKTLGFYADLIPIDSTNYTLATNEIDNVGDHA
ncbi:ThiF family adenylyltransferase [Mycobacterium hodleri]|uniref:ThiF family adenylyltransferase n=1 Tax=Mycolicibacterium hodleri TaxID=49897 RepID=A0A544VWC8_9MYCO|nr:ThiF family adenylyltransferase [Mycolicibacterium hodleri]TQR84293.1 ThiF family adenylyltransferase [Mycolicibacterium hodleri]